MKREKGIKAEKDIKPEPSGPVVAKRPRPVSAEISTAKRPGTVTRRQARVLEEAVCAMPPGTVTRRQARVLEEGPSEDDEDIEGLPSFANILQGAGKNAGEDAGEDAGVDE